MRLTLSTARLNGATPSKSAPAAGLPATLLPVGAWRKTVKLKAHIDGNSKKEEDMAIRKTVRRGDSLWSLAGRYLGGGERYPQIVDFHNQQANRYNLRPIDKPDLIFVGETILIPPRPKVPKPGSGTKAEGGRLPIPLNLKVTYAIGRDTPAITYAHSYGDYTVKTELSGEIGIEIASQDRYRHSLELFMSKNPMQAKQKLHDAYDPALVALTAKPEMVYESNHVKINAPIATAANLGPYTIRVLIENPMHYSGTIEPPTISGTVKAASRDFKYSADIVFKVDVIWHKKPKGGPEQVKVTEQVKTVDLDRPTNSIDWKEIATVVTWSLVGTALMIFGMRMVPQPNGATTIEPFIHYIDPHDPRNRRYINRNA
jgi:hypothetical protein